MGYLKSCLQQLLTPQTYVSIPIIYEFLPIYKLLEFEAVCYTRMTFQNLRGRSNGVQIRL